MKQGWEIIPFENSIVKVKYTTKIPSNDYLEQGLYPIVSQEEGLISGYWNDEANVFKISSPVVIFGDHTRILKYVDFDFVLGADGVKILQPIESINAKFFKLYLESCKIPSLGYSRHYKLLKELQVPVPPREEQERIVAELNCLSGVIERKREQLKELDALAQSIFYQMFGDPNTNNRNWNVVKLNTTCDNLDYQRRPITAKDRIEGDIPYYGASGVVDYVQDYIFDGDYLLVSEDGANLEVRHTPIAFSIKGKTWVNNHAHILKFEHYCTQLFMEYYINLLDISDIITGCAQPKLTQANLNSIDVFDISIEKQQEFADKIEAIEKQKELIKKSISETETLFNARMDYYFN